MKKTWVEVSRSALRKNIRAIKTHIKPAQVMAVVKSNAYGHDATMVAKTIASDVAWFGVDDVDEGMALRKAGIKKPVLVMGYVLHDRLADCAKHRLSIVAYNLETLAAIKKLRGRFNIHIKIETGTTRQGIEGHELEAFVRRAQAIPSVTIEGIYTHFANIEDTTDTAYALGQLRMFERTRNTFARWGVDMTVTHTAASAAAILYPETHFDLVRLGIALYGFWPSKETKVSAAYRSKGLSFKPAMTWKTIVAQVKYVKKGTPVSYGLTERVPHDARIAVLPVGYWDGFDRGLSSVGHALIRGHRCKIIGRVCMNMTMVDVSDVPGVKPEDEVVLLGRQGKEEISAEEIATHLGTIQYEVVTRINPLIQRMLVI